MCFHPLEDHIGLGISAKEELLAYSYNTGNLKPAVLSYPTFN